MLCAEFPQVQYINLSEIVNVLKVVAIVTHVQSNLFLRTPLLYRHLYNMDTSTIWTPL